jgi:hypothetical protein
MAIDVDHGADSIQSDIEQVAVLYANGQDAVVRPLLESLLGAYPGNEGLRLWQMLFDFLQLKGDRAAFRQTGRRVRPDLRNVAAGLAPGPAQAGCRAGPGVAVCELQGVLTGDDLSCSRRWPMRSKLKRPLRVDCSGLLGCDDEASGRLPSC